MEGIRKVQARRKEEIVNATNRHRNGGPRFQEEKGIFELILCVTDYYVLKSFSFPVTHLLKTTLFKDNTYQNKKYNFRLKERPLHCFAGDWTCTFIIEMIIILKILYYFL